LYNSEKERYPMNGNFKISVMLSYVSEQKRLIKILHNICPNALITGYTSKEALIDAAQKSMPNVAFLDENYGLESGPGIGRELMSIIPHFCNLFFITDGKNESILRNIIQLRVSGVLPTTFTQNNVADEMCNLRYPTI
jgi:DNA-binding NarL/FixJ family response regulator